MQMKEVVISKYHFHKSRVLSQRRTNSTPYLMLNSILMTQASRIKSTPYLTPSVLCQLRSIPMAQAKSSAYLTPSALSPIRAIRFAQANRSKSTAYLMPSY